MPQLQALFERVTPQSLSNDLIISLALVVVLWLYILKKGVKNILVFGLALYLARGIISVIPFSVPSTELISGAVILFTSLTVLIYWLLSISAIGRTLSVAKSPVWKNLVFGVLVVGLLLVNILGGIEVGNKTIVSTIEQSLFSTEFFQLFWTVCPLIFIPFLKPGLKLKSKSKSKE